MKIISLHPDQPARDVQRALQALGLWTSTVRSADGAVQLVVEPQSAEVPDATLAKVLGVASVYSSPPAMPRVEAQGARAHIGDLVVGDAPLLMAGPCSVESEAQIHESAAMVAAHGATVLRGGCFKPRTSPYSFQGVGNDGLRWMREAADAHHLKVVTEAMGSEQVEVVARHADMIQIGARNMQNFALLHAVGRAGLPVLLKRGLSATIEEWLLAAEHTLQAGASAVVFCERGVRAFDNTTRFLMDLSAIALLRDVYQVPIIADPSHAAGRKDIIVRLGLASLAAGAHGLIIETHPDPAVACSDGPQQLNPEEWRAAATAWGFSPR